MSFSARRGTRLSLFAVALLWLAAGCAEDAAPPPPEDPSDEPSQPQYRILLPDGRIVLVTGVRRGDELVVGGDMLFPLHSDSEAGPRSATAQYAQLWPTRRIPYMFGAQVDATTRQRVLDAMVPWTAAGFAFVPVTDLSVDFVDIRGAVSSTQPWICGATVGNRGLASHYDAAPQCTTRDYVHEWGHVLGLYHEHERTDRGYYITVCTAIDPSLTNTIATRGGTDWGAYDFGSIMHYDAYGRNPATGETDTSQVRITPLDGRPLNSFGLNTTPSSHDLGTIGYLYSGRPPGVPLYQLYNPQYQDWFYTISLSERGIAMQQYGYYDYGIAARVEPAPIGNALAFRRLYKGPPQTDHFYTTSLSEFSTVQSYGWQDEGAEGYLFTAASPGLRALWRFSHWDPPTSDLMHFYTINYDMRATLESAGWVLDQVAGYVYPP